MAESDSSLVVRAISPSLLFLRTPAHVKRCINVCICGDVHVAWIEYPQQLLASIFNRTRDGRESSCPVFFMLGSKRVWTVIVHSLSEVQVPGRGGRWTGAKTGVLVPDGMKGRGERAETLDFHFRYSEHGSRAKTSDWEVGILLIRAHVCALYGSEVQSATLALPDV